MGELRGAAAARAAVVRGLSKMPLDKLAALSPEQLAKRLRKEVEGLVGTEVRARARDAAVSAESSLGTPEPGLAKAF